MLFVPEHNARLEGNCPATPGVRANMKSRPVMRRLAGVLAAGWLGLAMVLLQGVTLPMAVHACSCAGPRPLAEWAESGENAILVGTIGQPEGAFQPIFVDTWYHGEFPASEVWVPRGVDDEGACGYALIPGERRFFVLHGPRDELYSTNICLPSAPVETDEGQRYLAEAEEAFGAAGPPPPTASPAPPPEQPLDLSPLLDGSLVWVLGGVAVAGLLFGALAFAARRRPLS